MAKNMKKLYIGYFMARQARVSIGPSTARRMGPAGTIRAARKFLGAMDLKRFGKRSESAFRRELDLATEELCTVMPKTARHWGSARKFLNIFLRDCSYNKYLSAHFKMDRLEPWLEVPLDSHVAKGLRQYAGQECPHPWPGVIHLTREYSDCLQKLATVYATEEQVNRVDLDVKLWHQR